MSSASLTPRYDQALATFNAVAISVPSQRWAASSPCTDWNAADVLGHMAYGQHALSRLAYGQPWPDPATRPEPPSQLLSPDPLSGWQAARDEALAAFAAADLTTSVMTPFGPAPLGQFLDDNIVVELTVHSWDLAQAAGVSHNLAPELVDFCDQVMRSFGEIIRGPGRCGPAGPADPRADATTALMAFLGRRPVSASQPA